jgi:hypothetical protein
MTGADDFLSYIREHHREPVPGTYACRIVPGSVRAFASEHASGVSFMLVVVDGEYRNREFSIRFCDRNDKFTPVVSRDMNTLLAWATALGVTGGNDLIGLVFKIGAATEAADGVMLNLDVRKGRNGLDDIVVSGFGGLRKGGSDVI